MKQKTNTTPEITLDEMINSELITNLIDQDDKDLKADGWTYKEVQEFAKSMTNQNKHKRYHNERR